MYETRNETAQVRLCDHPDVLVRSDNHSTALSAWCSPEGTA
jgi:hypothetical protein